MPAEANGAWRFGAFERVLLGVILLFLAAIAMGSLQIATQNAGTADAEMLRAQDLMVKAFMGMILLLIVGGPIGRAIIERVKVFRASSEGAS